MTQPTALFLADVLEDAGKPADIAKKAAAELRRLHAQQGSETAPPQRKPLTEQEIWHTYKNLWMFHPAEEPRLAGDVLKFARAIERAHGIGGAPEERNFCPRCGKRTQDIHTCTPP